MATQVLAIKRRKVACLQTRNTKRAILTYSIGEWSGPHLSCQAKTRVFLPAYCSMVWDGFCPKYELLWSNLSSCSRDLCLTYPQPWPSSVRSRRLHMRHPWQKARPGHREMITLPDVDPC